jgi:RHH-type proline utilization regulon transcriptional repressor/proline dehydrogenase/delta 1-pyrroline-5-carboxylate dehydrogenase
LQEYRLNSDEGIVLMGIAEALLRIPDIQTQNLFLKEKLFAGKWQSHLFQRFIAGQFGQYCIAGGR